jgi:predicted nucleotidyltransferase
VLVSDLRFEDRFNEHEVALLEVFNRHEVRFILVGGVAVAFHGARNIENTTNDIDFLTCPTEPNAKRVFEAVREIESQAAIVIDSRHLENFAQAKKRYTIHWMYCDVLTAGSEPEFESFYCGAIATEVKGQSFKILSIEHLIEMKTPITNISDDQLEKHKIDVEELRRILINR